MSIKLVNEFLSQIRGQKKLDKLATQSSKQISNLVTQTHVEQPSDEKVYSTSSGTILDEWQYNALTALLNGKHVIIDAPTSAGKTRVIEAILDYQMNKDVRLIYTSPIKSLSNDKYREFCARFGSENVGINTGDYKENLSAPIILATLETYRNSLLGIEPNISRHIVVYDEYHFLQDESRGSAWEESLILTPKGSQLILLSASVPNCEDFASWITELTNIETKVIRVSKRPVPLIHAIHTKHGYILADLLNLTKTEQERLANKMREHKKPFSKLRLQELYQEICKPIKEALSLDMGPIVVYAGRRGDAENIAVKIAGQLHSLKDAPRKKLSDRISTLHGWSYVPEKLKRIILRTAVAYHHSGIILPGRICIETLLKEGFLKVCVGTMGISMGVNFAVRSALVFDESRPGEGGETIYSNTEIMQMLGRAGRRGFDQNGFSIWLNAGRYALQKPRQREDCRSSLKIDPVTVLGILGHNPNVDYLQKFYKKSFFVKSLSHNAQRHIKSDLRDILKHLKTINALDEEEPTKLGNLARHFPQAGGLIIASLIASGQFNSETFTQYLQLCACFCSAHFKEISKEHADLQFLRSLNLYDLIDEYYPKRLFDELYDEVRRFDYYSRQSTKTLVFRELNMGAASIVKHWLDPNTSWEDLVETHGSKFFSDGDCMNVLFRFVTFLQSLIRLEHIENGKLSEKARSTLQIMLREPLDARLRMQ